MKKIICFVLLLPMIAFAQDKDLLVQGNAQNLYLNHQVIAKENYYSIGRLYNVSPKEITAYNKLDLEAGLDIGQGIKIPLTGANFFQNGKAATDETFVPVYYEVKQKEGLYRVAVNNKNLVLDKLRMWNNITNDDVQVGARLVVGFLKVKTDLSALAKNGIGTTINSGVNRAAETEQKETVVETIKEAAPAPAQKDVVKKKTEPVKVAEPEKPTEMKPGRTENAAPLKTVAETAKTGTAKIAEGGVFKSLFEDQVKGAELTEASGEAGVFKSTSGWKDKKYYCLFNSASPGTVIKISNPANGKFVFAKVLDLMPDINQNNGLLILVSNAAADELGVDEGNIECTITHVK